MYQLTEKQIEFISNDLRSRGIYLESLHADLLDHICCIVEAELDENTTFESFYEKTIPRFFKTELSEIQNETIALLTYKNYYTMKKMMMFSGIFSVIMMILGLIWKIMHYPGAVVFLPVGVLSGSLVFIPLLFALKARELESKKDRFLLGCGALSATLYCLSIVFKVMHWPSPIFYFYTALGLMIFIFLPVYLFQGLKNPVTRVNTIAVSILIVLGCCLLFAMVRTPRAQHLYNLMSTHDLLRNEQILRTEQRQLNKIPVVTEDPAINLGRKIYQSCDDLKARILESEAGIRASELTLENATFLEDRAVSLGTNTRSSFAKLSQLITEYNQLAAGSISKIPITASFVDNDYIELNRILITWNQITQMQMIVLQNERELLAVK